MLLNDMDKDQVPVQRLLDKKSTYVMLFAMLHVNKDLLNGSRRNLLNVNGQLVTVAQFYTLYNMSDSGDILRAHVPMKCIYGRDRQSDVNSWTLVSPYAQAALSLSNPTTIQLYPEPYLTFKTNEKLQPKIKPNTSMKCATNLNGDIFIFLHPPHKLVTIGHAHIAHAKSIALQATVTPTKFFGFVHQVCLTINYVV